MRDSTVNWSFGEPGAPWFVMPRSPEAWGGAAALWVTVAGWAGASRRRFGSEPPVFTPVGTMNESACLDATRLAGSASGGGGRASRVPESLKQVVKDARRIPEQRSFAKSIAAAVPPDAVAPPFVWQHHELFHRAGEALARRLDVPLVSYVHAPVVWEARRWGVTRRGTGSLLERFGESPQLRRSDLVACVSEEVAAELGRFGVPEDRVVVAPMAVDPERFAPSPERRQRSESDPFTIGWVGSFRKFHALGMLLEAVRLLRDRGAPIRLVLIGDGFERPRLVEQVEELGIVDIVEFRGQVVNTDLPAALREMDAAVITAEANQEFHYSPLKLREYMAMALPVVAASVGDVSRMISDGVNGLLYEPGDVGALADALGDLVGEPKTADRIGSAARASVESSGTWDEMLDRACGILDL